MDAAELDDLSAAVSGANRGGEYILMLDDCPLDRRLAPGTSPHLAGSAR
jgi:hypothetical protein